MLESDPKRQAVHTLRGYAYQIWQSLYEWVSLSEKEVLYLEGAEDIDKLGPQSAETIQVKDMRSRSITLNSEEVLKAITHFWEHKKRNTHIKIKYRFLTTAERGREQSLPFGDKKGLDFWDDCKYKDTDLRPLKEFLLTKDTLPNDLKDFIRSKDDALLRSELILGIEWDTGNPDKKYLEELIRKKLIYHGDRLSIPPSESERVLDTLLRVVYETVCKEEERKLERSDFLRLFEQSTSINLPISSMRAAFNAMSSRLRSILPSSLGSAPEIDIFYQETFPVLPEKYSKRTELISSLEEKLRSNKILVLQGSTGTGKSTIGALLIQQLKLRCQWINLRGKDAESINAIFWNINLGIKDFNDEIFVIDDFSFEKFRKYENSLVGLVNIALSRNSYIVITTQEDLPDKLSHYLPQIGDLIVNAPLMKVEEIRELSELYNCPSVKKNDLWSNIILLKTCGHPQLVHAKIRKLESQGWPDPSFEALIKPDDFETIKREVQKRLILELPFESARTLSYRLSILYHPFRKKHALIMGEKSPPIEKPGEAFDILVGPWIERLVSDYYNISPLLINMAKEIWSEEEIKELHAQAVRALLSEKILSPIEVSNAMFHGIIGESGESLQPLMHFLLMNKKGVLKQISEDLRWLTVLAITPGQKIYPKNPVVSLILRHIQFRVAAETDKKDLAVMVAQAWEREIEDCPIEELKAGHWLLFLIETLIRHEVPFPLVVVLSRVKELFQLFSNEDEVNVKEILKSFKDKDVIPTIILFAIVRCNSYNDLLELINTIDEESEDNKDYYLSLLGTKDDWSNFLISQVYLNEYKSSSPKWLECLEVFNHTIEKALSWKALSLVSNAYHMTAVIYDEHLEESDKALEVLDKARRHLGNDNPIIEDARAMIFFRQEKDIEALEILERILPVWETDFDITPLLSYRRAEISATRLGDWNKATMLAREGANCASRLNNKIMEMGFRADRAFALWKNNDRLRSIDLFADVVHDFCQLPDPHKELSSYALQKKVGYALRWLLHDVLKDHTNTFLEPPPSWFSNQEVDESIKHYPLQPIDYFWMDLAEIEFELSLDDKIFNHFKERSHITDYPVIKMSLTKLTISHALRKHELSSLVQYFNDFIAATELFKKSVSSSDDLSKKLEASEKIQKIDDLYESLIILLSFSIVILFEQNRNITEMLTTWRSDADRLGITRSELLSWFAFLEVAVSTSDYELTKILSDGSAGAGERYVASILLSTKETVSPEVTLYSHFLLFNLAIAKQSIWGREVEDHLERIIVPVWAKIANKKAFTLLNPRMNVPKILEACQDESTGFEKTAKVLFTAKDAVQLRIPEDMLMSLKRFIQ